MAKEVIENFTYIDESKKVSSLVKEHYPMIKLEFDRENKILSIYSLDKNKLKVVYNMLNIINRFNLK